MLLVPIMESVLVWNRTGIYKEFYFHLGMRQFFHSLFYKRPFTIQITRTQAGCGCKSSGSSHLYNRMTLAIFIWPGNTPYVRDKLQICISGWVTYLLHNCRDMELISSYPVAVFFKDNNDFSISFTVTGDRNIVSDTPLRYFNRLLLVRGIALASVGSILIKK